MHKDLFCEKCILQFDKKYVFDLHLLLVHREEIKVKSEPQICEEKFQKSQKHEKFALIMWWTKASDVILAILYSNPKKT